MHKEFFPYVLLYNTSLFELYNCYLPSNSLKYSISNISKYSKICNLFSVSRYCTHTEIFHLYNPYKIPNNNVTTFL